MEETSGMTAAEKVLLCILFCSMDFGGEVSETGIRRQLEAMIEAEL